MTRRPAAQHRRRPGSATGRVSSAWCIEATRCVCSRTDLADRPTALVANLPYNVAVPVLLHLLAEFPIDPHGLVMVQAEVAERLAADPGGKIYGVPSVKARFFGEVRRPAWCGRRVLADTEGVLRAGAHRPVRDVAVARRRGLPQQGVRAHRHRLSPSGARRPETRSPSGPARHESAERLLSASIDPSRRGETLSHRRLRSVVSALGCLGSGDQARDPAGRDAIASGVAPAHG